MKPAFQTDDGQFFTCSKDAMDHEYAMEQIEYFRSMLLRFLAEYDENYDDIKDCEPLEHLLGWFSDQERRCRWYSIAMEYNASEDDDE